MLKLIEVNEQNWMDIRKLSVNENQRNYLDSATGILARGYAYRASRARVIGIAQDETMIGAALVKDMDEEPACYDLQQFMIDRRYQGKGFGTEALHKLLSQLEKERKYGCVEVCVKKDDLAALHVYEKLGFIDTGYVRGRTGQPEPDVSLPTGTPGILGCGDCRFFRFVIPDRVSNLFL